LASELTVGIIAQNCRFELDNQTEMQVLSSLNLESDESTT